MASIGLALSGGGSKGAFTVGALQVLLGRVGLRSIKVISVSLSTVIEGIRGAPEHDLRGVQTKPPHEA